MNEFPRSILYTPALDAKILHSARKHDADLYLVDLEDSIPLRMKPKARQIFMDFIEKYPDTAFTAVRINEMSSKEYILDMAMLLELPKFPAYIFMTMVKSAEEIILLRNILSSANRSCRIYVTIETVEAIENIFSIADVCDGMIFGSADLAASLCVDISWDNMLYARQRMAMACARSKICCIDTGTFHFNDPSLLAMECLKSKDLGFHGKGTVHPAQLETINGIFRPNDNEVSKARELTDIAEKNQNGICVINGSMIGPPFIKKAQLLLKMSDAWNTYFKKSKEFNTQKDG